MSVPQKTKPLCLRWRSALVAFAALIAGFAGVNAAAAADSSNIQRASAHVDVAAGELVVSFDTDTTYVRKQVMIDADDSILTGFSRGFDVLIENGRIYEYQGVGDDWAPWPDGGTIAVTEPTGNDTTTLTWRVPLNVLPPMSIGGLVSFRLRTADGQFEQIGALTQRAPSIVAASESYTVDFGIDADIAWKRIYWNTDNNESTGVASRHGADILIENGVAYAYTGSDGEWAFGTTLGSSSAGADTAVAVFDRQLFAVGATSVALFERTSDPYARRETGSNGVGSRTTSTVRVEPAVPSPPATRIAEPVTFSPRNISPSPLRNPERGLYELTKISDPSGTGSFLWNLDAGELAALAGRPDGISLVSIQVQMDGLSETTVLPDVLLDELDRALTELRSAGMKAIVRGRYNGTSNGCGYDEGEEFEPPPDAPLPTMLGHINQLAFIINAHKEAVAFIEAGMIGSYGEWHCSSQTLDEVPLNESPEAKQAVVDTWLAAVSDRPVLVRNPQFEDDEASFDASDRVRVGHYNDCFLASPTDVGTYSSDPTVRDAELEFLDEDTIDSAMGGETCNFSASDEQAAYFADLASKPGGICGHGRNRLERHHWTFLNDNGELMVQAWEAGDCWSEFVDRLGYRYDLDGVEIKANPTEGASSADVTLEVENKGFARLHNDREVHLVLRRIDGQESAFELSSASPRSWMPDSTTTLTATVDLATLVAGSYEIGLRIPDNDAPDEGAYAIRFANGNPEDFDLESGTNWYPSYPRLTLQNS